MATKSDWSLLHAFEIKKMARYYIKFAITYRPAFGSIGNLDGTRACRFKRSCVQTPVLLFPPWFNVFKQLRRGNTDIGTVICLFLVQTGT